MPPKRNKKTADAILKFAMKEVTREINCYLKIEDKESGLAGHAKALARQEFLSCLTELASEWFDGQIDVLEKNDNSVHLFK